MDITVTRLNNRLALQLPAELPLGLVFVVGTVENISRVATEDDSRPRLRLDLVETQHRLRCELTERVAAGIQLKEAEKVRAGGHLVFDPHRADYYLLVRDLELIGAAPVESEPVELSLPEEVIVDSDAVELPLVEAAPPSILAEIARRSEEASIAQADLPDWVREIAPPEVRKEMEEAETRAASITDPAGDNSLLPDDEQPIDESSPVPSKNDESLENMVTFLAEAMDSNEEIELDPEMASRIPDSLSRAPAYEPVTLLQKHPAPKDERNILEQVTLEPFQPSPQPAKQSPEQADTLLLLLFITLVVVLIAVLSIILISWLR